MPGINVGVSPRRVRELILQQSWQAKAGHIGSCLSVADIVLALYDSVLRISTLDDPDRDRFIMSKGHAALALYAVLHLKGWISEETLSTYCRDGSLLGAHPDRALKGIDFSTGTLGHGLSFGAGAALAARLQRSPRRVFVLVSDGECNEGSVWEAAMFSAHHRLANLVVIIDTNGQQALGYTDQVMNLSPLAERWRAFGWDAHEVDGHDVKAISAAIAALDTASGPPHVLVANTISGKGVSFMERQIKWHYWVMSAEEYRQALDEVRSAT
jgi:transketolase